MVNLKKEFRRWGKQLRNGNNDYMLITKDCEKNTWILVFNKIVKPIKQIDIEADTYGDGHGFMYDYTWDLESIPNFWCALIIRKRGELLCKDCSGIHGFLNGKKAPLTAFRVRFYTEDFEFEYEFKDAKARITTYNLHKYRGDEDTTCKGDWLWE